RLAGQVVACPHCNKRIQMPQVPVAPPPVRQAARPASSDPLGFLDEPDERPFQQPASADPLDFLSDSAPAPVSRPSSGPLDFLGGPVSKPAGGGYSSSYKPRSRADKELATRAA